MSGDGEVVRKRVCGSPLVRHVLRRGRVCVCAGKGKCNPAANVLA